MSRDAAAKDEAPNGGKGKDEAPTGGSGKDEAPNGKGKGGAEKGGAPV